MVTKLTPVQAKKLLGKCSGCFHACAAAPGEKSAPGASSVCKLCVRNPESSRDSSARADDGKIIYGQRDCFIAFDRFEMELRGETFLKGVAVDG